MNGRGILAPGTVLTPALGYDVHAPPD
jgi:hypothetical protein